MVATPLIQNLNVSGKYDWKYNIFSSNICTQHVKQFGNGNGHKQLILTAIEKDIRKQKAFLFS